MTRWHRLVGAIVKDGIASRRLDPRTDPYELATLLTATLEGALMLARLLDDPAHMDRAVTHLETHIESLRANKRGGRT